MAGLGNADVHIVTTVSGFAVYECQNGGGNTAPGQNRVLEGPVTAPTDIPSSAIKNGGELLFSCSASDPNGLTGTFALTC